MGHVTIFIIKNERFEEVGWGNQTLNQDEDVVGKIKKSIDYHPEYGINEVDEWEI